MKIGITKKHINKLGRFGNQSRHIYSFRVYFSETTGLCHPPRLCLDFWYEPLKVKMIENYE